MKVLNKHKLMVLPGAGGPGPTYVYFQCRKCVANVAIERALMERMLTGKGSILSSSNFFILWGECKGA